ncbi:hypothetical protein JCM11641_001672 [Rhodosporidiobolus odoratus]
MGVAGTFFLTATDLETVEHGRRQAYHKFVDTKKGRASDMLSRHYRLHGPNTTPRHEAEAWEGGNPYNDNGTPKADRRKLRQNNYVIPPGRPGAGTVSAPSAVINTTVRNVFAHEGMVEPRYNRWRATHPGI